MKWITLCVLSLLAVLVDSARERRQSYDFRNELGDIILSEEQEQLLNRVAESSKEKRIVDSGILTKPWPKGIIPYVMDPHIMGTRYEKSYKKAMRVWQRHTCIRFVQRTNEDAYITLTNGTTCNSGVGMWDSRSYSVYLSKHCRRPGDAMHELAHVIGFWHEHQRPDRDDYIRIIYDNLDGSLAAVNSYKKLDSIFVDDFGVGYDYASITHYGKDAYAKPKHDAFKVKKDLPQCLEDVGQRVSISIKDIEQARKLYKCPEKPIPSLCKLLRSKSHN